jgi:tetratricopeptide (TPR) repeat protein
MRDTSPQTFVFWVHASTRARFAESYREIADRLELPRRNDPQADLPKLVRDWLRDESNGIWLMVLDNVDDFETFSSPQPTQNDSPEHSLASLQSYIPQSRNGSILITSRNKEAAARLVGGHNKIKEVHVMDEARGLQLLRNKLVDTSKEDGAVDLLRALDYVPLAITQAAAYINRQARTTASTYLTEFQKSDEKRNELLKRDGGDLRRDGTGSNSVLTTWQISFDRIRKERQSAADLLSLMSFFNHQGIPESVLRWHGKITIQSEDDDGAKQTFSDDFEMLRAYSLIIATADTDTCETHALVQLCTQVWLSSFSNIEQWKQKFVKTIAHEFPTGDFENWAKCQQLLPHIESLYDYEPDGNECTAEWAHILTNAAWYMWMKGSYKIAQRLTEAALRAREEVLGQTHEITLTSVTLLALVLQSQGKYNEAEKLHRRTLKENEKQLGAYHPSTLTSVSNLALVLHDQGKYEEAETLHRRALEGYQKELGARYSASLLMSLNNLAAVLRAQGKYTEAEKLNRQALEGREKELGMHHPATLTSVSNLALVLQDQAKYDEAERLNRRALEGYEEKLGDHPYTLRSLNNLALVLQDQGKYEEAEKLNRKALKGFEKSLDVNHPDTLMSVHNLAMVLRLQRKYAEAEKLNRRALEGREKLDIHHPDTLMSVSNLALVLQDQGKYAEAEKLNRRALKGYREKLPEDHPYTLTSVSNLARVLMYQGQYSEAEKLNREALEKRKKVLGVDHRHTIMSVYDLATLLRLQGRYTEASGLYQRACDGFEKNLEADHQIARDCLNDFEAMKAKNSIYARLKRIIGGKKM